MLLLCCDDVDADADVDDENKLSWQDLLFCMFAVR